jgi:hypothetical protein
MTAPFKVVRTFVGDTHVSVKGTNRITGETRYAQIPGDPKELLAIDLSKSGIAIMEYKESDLPVNFELYFLGKEVSDMTEYEYEAAIRPYVLVRGHDRTPFTLDGERVLRFNVWSLDNSNEDRFLTR